MLTLFIYLCSNLQQKLVNKKLRVTIRLLPRSDFENFQILLFNFFI